jgi:hypothetical protein
MEQRNITEKYRQNSFLIMQGWEAAFELLSAEEIAEITMNLFLFNRGAMIPALHLTTPLTKMMWKNIEPTLIINREKYFNKINNAKLVGHGK